MASISNDVRTVIDKAEWVAIATSGPDGPHLSATWGDYVRGLGIDQDIILIPAGRLQRTEENLKADPRIELMFATREVIGSRGTSGQGCVLHGRAEMETAGPRYEAVKARFSWARAALVIHVAQAETQL